MVTMIAATIFLPLSFALVHALITPYKNAMEPPPNMIIKMVGPSTSILLAIETIMLIIAITVVNIPGISHLELLKK